VADIAGGRAQWERRRAPGRPRSQRRRGQAMVEFALAFPFLLLLAVSIADYGYYLEHINNITTVTRDGTRYASENTTSGAWNAGCPAPTATSTGTYTCPAVSASTTISGGPYNTTSSYSSITLATVPVPLPVGSDLFIGGTTGVEVFVYPAAVDYSASPTSVNISQSVNSSQPWKPSAQVNSGATVTWLPPSNNVEALVQDEAESLTVPEGGLALDNIDCNWTGGSPPAAGDPAWGATASIPGSFPAGSGASGTPTSCVSIVYYQSSDGSYSSSSLSASSDVVAWWSSDASSDTGCLENSSGCLATSSYPNLVGDVVQVTVMYDWSQTSPGPIFDVLNSAFKLHANITAQYALVVES
jgi:Flp pilus assembly protein TadG